MPDFVAKPNFFATNGKINAKLFGIFAKKPYLCIVNSIKQHLKRAAQLDKHRKNDYVSYRYLFKKSKA